MRSSCRLPIALVVCIAALPVPAALAQGTAADYRRAMGLREAYKDFDLLVMPGMDHGFGGPYGEHKRFDLFVRHLLGVSPPAWKDLEEKRAGPNP